MIKAVFFDIDGTLISIRKHMIPASAVKAVAALRAKGVLTFLCTSRAVQFLSNIPGIEYDGLVCLTGAHCLDKDRKDIHCHRMDPSDVAAAVMDCVDSNAPIIALSPDRIYVHNPMHPAVLNALATGGLKPGDVSGGFLPFPDLAGAGHPEEVISKLNILQMTGFFHSGKEEERMMSLMPHSHTERWIEDFVDVIGDGASKALGLEVMGRHFGFSREETMAIGDGANDIPMLRYAGVGIAMGNASDAVKEAADYITGDVDDDGLAAALGKYFDI